MKICKAFSHKAHIIPKNAPNFTYIRILCFISNPVPERPVDDSKNFDGVAYIA